MWENWRNPQGEWLRTFAVITTDANELVGRIHDRMPAILKPEDYERWLGSEPDPRELRAPFPSAPMVIWPISPRVNSPKNERVQWIERDMGKTHKWKGRAGKAAHVISDFMRPVLGGYFLRGSSAGLT